MAAGAIGFAAGATGHAAGGVGSFAEAVGTGTEVPTNLAWLAAFATGGTTTAFGGAGAGGFTACAFDSLHCSRSSSNSRALWYRSAGSLARVLMMRSLSTG